MRRSFLLFFSRFFFLVLKFEKMNAQKIHAQKKTNWRQILERLGRRRRSILVDVLYVGPIIHQVLNGMHQHVAVFSGKPISLYHYGSVEYDAITF